MLKKSLTYLMLTASSLLAIDNPMPFSTLSEENTKNLECAFSQELGESDMRGSLKMLDIKDKDDILYYASPEREDIPINNYSKALILDYLYQDKTAYDYYRNSMPLLSESKRIGYDIAYFLARSGNIYAAGKVLSKTGGLMEEFKIAKLTAYVFIANDKTVPHEVLFKCKRRNLGLLKLRKNFRTCAKNKGF